MLTCFHHYSKKKVDLKNMIAMRHTNTQHAERQTELTMMKKTNVWYIKTYGRTRNILSEIETV